MSSKNNKYFINLKKVKNISNRDLQGLNIGELQYEYKRIANVAQNRMNRLQSFQKYYGTPRSIAQANVEDNRKLVMQDGKETYFPFRESWDEVTLRNKIVEVLTFLDDKTSKVAGWIDTLTDVQSRLTAIEPEQYTQKFSDEFWELYYKLSNGDYNVLGDQLSSTQLQSYLSSYMNRYKNRNVKSIFNRMEKIRQRIYEGRMSSNKINDPDIFAKKSQNKAWAYDEDNLYNL